jgi:hypothetical protein
VAHGLKQAAQVVHLAPFIKPVVITLCGVKLFADWDSEAFYLEASEFHSRAALMSGFYAIKALGLEMMDEDECPAEETPEGHTRIWLAQVAGDIEVLVHAWPELDLDADPMRR